MDQPAKGEEKWGAWSEKEVKGEWIQYNTRKNVFRRKGHPSSPFLHTAGWNVDVLPGAQVAMLDYEAEAYSDILEQKKRRSPDFWWLGSP